MPKNPMLRPPQWLKSVLGGLQDSDVPRMLCTPDITAVVDILSVADDAVSDEVTTTAQQTLPDQACSAFLLQADPNNTINVNVGVGNLRTATAFLILTPGEFFAANISNVNLISVGAEGGAGNIRVVWVALRNN